MARRTGRVTFLFEYDTDHVPHWYGDVYAAISDEGQPEVYVNLADSVIGEPTTEIDTRLNRCAVSEEAFIHATNGMVHMGGSFAHHIGKALQHADSSNREKLLNEFWGLFCNYLPKEYGR